MNLAGFRKGFVLATFAAAPLAWMASGCTVGSQDPDSEGSAALDGPEAVGEAAAAVGEGEPCFSACNCDLGLDCVDTEEGRICVAPPDFSPMPEEPYCFSQCQCDYGEICVFGPSGTAGFCEHVGPCSSDCDCGMSMVCYQGQCYADFGPYPECRCDAHCPAGQICDGYCH